MPTLPIGVLVPLTEGPDDELAKLVKLGLHSCQVCCWKPQMYTPKLGQTLTQASRRHGVSVTTLWAGYPGPAVWNFTDGPKTIGLVPAAYRAERVEALKAAARFAASIGLASITTHVGFIPEDPNDALFAATLEALRQVVETCRAEGVEFWFETGQETPVTLLRTIEALRRTGLGVNLDTANLILYGKANPVDALDVIGQFVRGVHAKDGLYPTDGDHLGKEVPLGQGKVDFPRFMARLRELGYGGAITIEREISGPQQVKDIQAAVELLRPLCG